MPPKRGEAALEEILQRGHARQLAGCRIIVSAARRTIGLLTNRSSAVPIFADELDLPLRAAESCRRADRPCNTPRP